MVWWDKKFDHSHEADVLLDALLTIREDCLMNLGMADPPNPASGHFYNVYLHHSGQDGDSLGKTWGNGQGTDPYRLPFLTIRYQDYDSDVVDHEGFHVFQYERNSPGFKHRDDSTWYIETSAQWYRAYKNPDGAFYLDSGVIIGNPQLALWHSFYNQVRR